MLHWDEVRERVEDQEVDPPLGHSSSDDDADEEMGDQGLECASDSALVSDARQLP